jgi:hypothetical protein
MSASRVFLAALLIFLSVTGIYIFTVVTLDNTDAGTTNGLWKSPLIKGWEQGTDHRLDSGEWLYTPLYGVLCRFIPDRWVSYGSKAPLVTFRKMAMLNSVFGGMASAFVFLLAMRFLSSVLASIAVVLGHGCAAFVVINSVNSEDIMPAYAFFVLTAYFLFAYLDNNRIASLAGSIFGCAMLTLLHWTLMIPALAAVAAVGLVSRRIWTLVLYFGVFLLFLKVFMLGFRPSPNGPQGWAIVDDTPRRNRTEFDRIPSMRDILYPSKAAPNGYLGFRVDKIMLAFVGTGNYFVGGTNITDHHAAFGTPSILKWMKVSWVFASATLAALVWALLRKGSPPKVRLLAVFGLTLFAAGEMEHLYSQPQDPQSQIQPMFATTLGVIVILEGLAGRPRAMRALAVCLGGVFIWEGASNAQILFASRGNDTRYMQAAQELARIFPPENTVIVSQGWEEWNTWVHTETFGGQSVWYVSRNIGLTNGFIQHPDLTPEQAAAFMAKEIADQMAQGRRVVANVVWTGSREAFAQSLSSLTDIESARIYTEDLYKAFHTGRSWDTSVDKFVELEK